METLPACRNHFQRGAVAADRVKAPCPIPRCFDRLQLCRSEAVYKRSAPQRRPLLLRTEIHDDFQIDHGGWTGQV